MNPTQLLTHFNRLVDAADAIARFRRFILDIAVRGKLVEQNPNDEPAPYFGIGADTTDKKNRLRIQLPRGWNWTRVEDVADARLGKMLDKAKNSGKPYRYLRNTNVHWFDIRMDELKTMPIEDSEIDNFLLREDDVLICEGGHGIGRTAIWRTKDANFVFQKALHRVRPGPYLAGDFFAQCVYVYFHAGILQTYYTGVGIPHFTGVALSKLVFPLPPLAEQRRIVAKVDELMALCDRLEAAQAERENRRDRLVRASLHRLNQPADAQTFRAHARFTLDNLPHLTTRPEHVPHLRQTILNLAVRGQLVSQDPKNESASELLKRIQAEKARLIEAGELKNASPRSNAAPTDLQFDLQPGWAAARLSQIVLALQTGPFGSTLHQSDYSKDGIPVINPACIKNGQIIPVDGMAIGMNTLERLTAFKLKTGDIVLGRRGEMGRCAVVTEVENGWLCGTGSIILRLPTCLYARFIAMLIGSPMIRKHLGGSAIGVIMQSLNQSILMSMTIALPPLAEQRRIVAKVDELMALCDRLEAQLTTTQTESRRLLEAVLHDALSPTTHAKVAQ